MDTIALSENKDSKTYNADILMRLDTTFIDLKADKKEFYYIADSALFDKITSIWLLKEK